MGYEATMKYLRALGAKPAPKKCFTFSTHHDTRFRLAQHYWQELGAHVEVVLEARDLGGHLSTKAVLGGSTLAKRMRKATAYCYRLAAMPWAKQAKQKVVEALIYPLALYGCEAAPIVDSDMAKLTAAVAKAVGCYTQGSSNLLTAMTSAKDRNFCGQFTVLNRSLALLRRIVCKHTGAKQHIQRIYQHYVDDGMPGTCSDEQHIKPLPPCPPPGYGGRAAWNNRGKAKGPIGLLLGRIHGVMGYLSKDLIIRAYPDIAFDPLNCSKQHLKQHVDDLCTTGV